MMISPGSTLLTLKSGERVSVKRIIDHSIRLLWEETEGISSYRYDQRFMLADQDFHHDAYQWKRESDEQLSLQLTRGWELIITDVRASNPWGLLAVKYLGENLAKISGEHAELAGQWRFRENLPALFRYHPAPRSIWTNRKDGAPRSAMIVLTGALLEVFP